MQITTTVHYDYTPTRMALIKQTDNASAGEDRNWAPHTLAGGKVKQCSHSGKQQGCKMLNAELPHEQTIQFLDIHSQEMKTCGHKDYTYAHSSIIHKSQKVSIN